MSDTQKKTNKSSASKSKRSLIFSAICVAVSLVLAAGFVFAWFSITDKPQIDGSFVEIAQLEDNGYQFKMMGGFEMPPDNYIIFPGDSFVFEVEATRNNTAFGVKIKNMRLSEQDFFEKFLLREDLTSGIYQLEQSVRISNTPVIRENRYHDFDIDKYLAGTALSPAQKKQLKADFFRKFEAANTMFQAISIKVLMIGDNEDLDYPYTLTAEDYEDNTKAYYLSEDDTGISEFPEGTKFKVQFDYGNNDFYPSVRHNFGSGEGTYRMLNYNCFIAQQLFIGFLGE